MPKTELPNPVSSQDKAEKRRIQLAEAQKRCRLKAKESGFFRFNCLVRGEVGEKFEQVKKLSRLDTHEEILDLLLTAALDGKLPLQSKETNNENL